MPEPLTPEERRDLIRCVLDHGKGDGGHGTRACRYTHEGWVDEVPYILRDAQ